MEIAAVKAVAELAQAEQSEIVAAVYSTENLSFGPEYLIPKPFDPRLITVVAPAVAKAAMDDGVALRPIKDFSAYRDQLQQFVYHSGTMMKPLFSIAKRIQPIKNALSLVKVKTSASFAQCKLCWMRG